MDEVVHAVQEAMEDWARTVDQLKAHVKAIETCGRSGKGTEEANTLPRLNGTARDGLAQLKSLQFKLDLLSQQLPTEEEVQSALETLESWKEQHECLRVSLRNANLQAKENIRKAAQAERELLLGGGEESTVRRRNLETRVGMTSAAEDITESLRRTRQLMVQEVERGTSTLMTFEESTTVLKKAESEYRGHRSLLMRTRNLLSTMQRQDVLDRVILAVGFLLFSAAVLYVVSKRIGLLKLQRKVTAAIKAGAAGLEAVEVPGGERNLLPEDQVPAPNTHDEL